MTRLEEKMGTLFSNIVFITFEEKDTTKYEQEMSYRYYTEITPLTKYVTVSNLLAQDYKEDIINSGNFIKMFSDESAIFPDRTIFINKDDISQWWISGSNLFVVKAEGENRVFSCSLDKFICKQFPSILEKYSATKIPEKADNIIKKFLSDEDYLYMKIKEELE